MNPNIPGLNVTPNPNMNGSNGIGVVSLDPGGNYLVSSRNALQNIVNGPFLNCNQYKKQ